MEQVNQLIEELEKRLYQRRAEFEDYPGILDKLELRILGQMSLLMNKELSARLNLTATVDLDAMIDGRSEVVQELRTVLKQQGLRYDELSKEIWLPDGAQYIEYYDSPYLRVLYLDPISALTSKAVKAKEKNRYLIRDALKVYGDELSEKLTQYGVDLNYFEQTGKIER